MKSIKELQQKFGGSPFSELSRPLNQLPKYTSKIPVNFIPLNEIITFFTLNLIRPEYARFSESDLERFFAEDNQKQTVHETIYQTSKAWVDEAFEGDIYSQNKYRSRSIVEEMSNSIDAQPEEIHCTIEDGYYEIREVSGMGMSAQMICTKYLIPKESSKAGSERQIGRFGIGGFTKLAHLNSSEARVIVHTKTEQNPGLRLEFRLIQNLIHVSMAIDETITQPGTTTEVFSSEISRNDYQNIVTKHIDDGITIPIFINGNKLTPTQTTHSASISINGISIQKLKQDNDCYATTVKWHFPAATTITEGREKIIVDHDFTRNLVREKIQEIEHMPCPQWVQYGNTIAPLVAELQATNTSLLAKDNLLDFLIEVVQQKLGQTPCVMDNALYRPLAVDGVLRLHSLLTPKNWISRIATQAEDWDPKGTQVWIADMVLYEENDCFIYDKDHNKVFVERCYYEQMVTEGKLKQLDIILAYPPKEMNAIYAPQDKSLALQDNSLPEVTFHANLTEHPYHALYQQHGLLWLKGEAETKMLLDSHPDMLQILLNAKTLIAIYPEIPFITHPNSTSIERPSHPIAAVQFEGMRYYFHDEDTFFNEHYHPLSHDKYRIVKAKINQLTHGSERKIVEALPEQTITLTAQDILPVKNQIIQQMELVNGLGQTVDSSFTDKSLHDKHLEGPWYILYKGEGGLRSAVLFHKEQGIKLSLDAYEKYQILNGTWLVIEKELGFKSLYDLQTCQYLFKEADEIVVAKNYVLYKSGNQWYLGSMSGEAIFKFSLQSSSDDIVYFDCQKQDATHYHLSIMGEYGDVHLIKATKTTTWNFEHYKPTESMGFPVKATFKQNGTQLSIHNIETGHVSVLSNVQSTSLTSVNYRRTSAKKYYKVYYAKIPAENLYEPYYLVVKNDEHLSLINPNNMQSIPLELNWALSDIAGVQQRGLCFLLTHATIKENKASYSMFDRTNYLSALVNACGKTIVQGFDIRTLHAASGFYLFCDGSIYTPAGEKIIDEKASQAEMGMYKNKEYFFLHFREDKKDGNWYQKMYDMEGQLQSIPLEINSSIRDKAGFTQYKISDEDWLHTPYGLIKNGRLHATNNHPDPSINDLVVVHDYKAKQNRVLTRAGYPFFNEPLPEYHCLLRQHVLHISPSSPMGVGATLAPMALEKLRFPYAVKNMRHLNQLSLDAFQYGSSLRFIEWPSTAFQMLIPHISMFTYTASPEQAEDYQTIIRFTDGLSSEAMQLIIKLFNLLNIILHEQPKENLAQKLIDVVEIYGLNALSQLYIVLQKHHCNLQLNGAEFSHCKPLIDELPNLAGQLCYYLFYPAQRLLQAGKTPIFESFNTENTISLLNFMCAYQFDTHILTFLTSDPEYFIAKVKNWGAYADKSHFTRVIQHAIYHQADPNKHLYEREFLQNALDAYVSTNTRDASVDVCLYEERNRCVFSLSDQGIGMSLQEIFELYCLAGASAKRKDQHQKFIGGHGVGAFTAFHNAEYLRLKTGKNQDEYYHIILRPVYSAQNRIIDVQISWQKQSGHFKGTVIERVARESNPALDAARHLRTFKSHSKTIDANVACIRLNGEQINQPLTLLASTDLPELGSLRLYRSIEDMITVSGLSVRKIDDLDQFIPEEIRTMVRKQGLIIDLPKKLHLNRDRSDFIDSEKVYEFLKPYLLGTYIEAYVQLFLTEKIELSELPYDFFMHFERYKNNMLYHNPDVVQDAEDIRNQRPIQNYQKYHHIPRLHELLAHLPLFKTEKKEGEICNNYSLVELAVYYNQQHKLPDRIMAPSFLTHFVNQYDQQFRAQEWQNECAFGLDNVPEVRWYSSPRELTGDWRVLVEITRHIAQSMGHDIQVGFSSIKSGELMHAFSQSNTIYWNVFSVSSYSGIAYDLFKALTSHKLTLSSTVLPKLYNIISHELTHAILEDEHTNTHNRTFYMKQRKILTQFSKRIDQNTLVKQLQLLFDQQRQDIKQDTFFDWKTLVNKQLLNEETLGHINSLFHHKRRKVEGDVKIYADKSCGVR
jgi:hypothetical protein